MLPGACWLEQPVPTALTQLIIFSIVDERIPVRGRVGVGKQGGALHGRLVLISDGEVAKGLEREDSKQVGHGAPFVDSYNVSVPEGYDIAARA